LSSKLDQRSRSLGTKMRKLFSAHIFVKSGSIYVKPRSIKMITGQLYT